MRKSIIEFSESKAHLLASELQRAIDRCRAVLDKYPEQLDAGGIPKNPDALGGCRHLLNAHIIEANHFLLFFKTATSIESSTINLVIDDAVQIQELINTDLILNYAERHLQKVPTGEEVSDETN